MLTLAITALTLSQALSFLAQLKTNVSETSISIVRANVANDIQLDDGDWGRQRKVGF
jgi:hypothetical protein